MARKGPAVTRVTTAVQIYREIQRQIVTMELLPGAALNEKNFIEQFGVSRTPVREALIRLADDRLVEVFPQSGTFVARIRLDMIPDAILIRQALECVTVERAAKNVTTEGITRLDELVDLQEFYASKCRSGPFQEADDAFHEQIALIGGCPGVWEHLKTVKMQIDRARRMTMPILRRLDQVLDEHRAIRTAIAAGDPAAAQIAMRKHLSAVLPDIGAIQKRYPEFFV